VGRIRWYRIGLLFERDGEPFTATYHVRALSGERARALVAERVGGPHRVHACESSAPLRQVAEVEEIVAHYGPYRRSWNDPMVASLRAGGTDPTSTG